MQIKYFFSKELALHLAAFSIPAGLITVQNIQKDIYILLNQQSQPFFLEIKLCILLVLYMRIRNFSRVIIALLW